MKIVFVLLLCAGSAFGQTTAGRTNHYEVLKKEQMFCVAGGFSGAVTPAGHSLMAVAQQKDAATVFTRLTHEDSATAQLFGLLGLKTIGAPEFKNALARLSKDKSQVTVLVGCIAGPREVATVAREIEQGHWSLGLPAKAAK